MDAYRRAAADLALVVSRPDAQKLIDRIDDAVQASPAGRYLIS